MNSKEILHIDKNILALKYKGDLSVRKIYIGENVSSIGAEAFSMCSNLESIVVDENNKWFTSGNGCNAIIEKATGTLLVGCYKTTIPEFVKEIGPFAFCGQNKLKAVTIPAHIHKLHPFAFDGCCGLVELKIGNGVKFIGEYCFRNCVKLEVLHLPNTKIDIDATVFGVTPFNWDDMGASLIEWRNDPMISPHFEGILNIFFDGNWEEYALNGDFVENYLSCSVIENTRIIYVNCKDVKLKYNKWNFDV